MGVKAFHDGTEHSGDYLRIYKSDVQGLVAAASDVLAVGDTGRGMGGMIGRAEPARHEAALQGGERC